MKYKLETIPVWDAFKEDSECPLCRLSEKAEEKYLKFYLGSSVMNPETRVEVNKTGFCPAHFSGLLSLRSNHGLGLITHTHLEKQIEILDRHFRDIKGEAAKALGKGLPGKPKKLSAAIGKLSEYLRAREQSCLICDRIEYTLKRYAFTIVHLWKSDGEFREIFNSSRGFCFHHLPDLLSMAEEVLGASALAEFAAGLVELTEKSDARLEKEILWFTQKFDSKNFDKPWGTSEDAHYRTIQKLTGRTNREIRKL